MGRRKLATLLVAGMAGLVQPTSMASDPNEWYRRFREFLKQLNKLIMSMNDDQRLDYGQWEKVRRAFHDLEELK
jgi:hypothetical protein